MGIRIKICGITREEDVEAAIEEGADLLGFNLWRGSKRAVAPHTARALVRRVASRATSVGVFVLGEPADPVVSEHIGLDWIQLHNVAASWPVDRVTRPVLRGVPVDRALTPEDLTGGDWFLLDAPQAGHGGGGRAFDWAFADGLKGHPRLFLAGGLDPSNVGELVRRLRPYAVDVASGVESEPGKKDRAKMRAFVAAVRAAEKELP